jgi:hypothetical protein
MVTQDCLSTVCSSEPCSKNDPWVGRYVCIGKGGMIAESDLVIGDVCFMLLCRMFCIVSWSMVTVLHSKLVSTSTSHDICHAQGNDRIDAV